MNDVMPTANGSSLHRRKTCYGILFLPSLIRLGLQSWTTVWNQPLLGIYVGLFFGIMISKTIGFRGLAYFQTHPYFDELRIHALHGLVWTLDFQDGEFAGATKDETSEVQTLTSKMAEEMKEAVGTWSKKYKRSNRNCLIWWVVSMNSAILSNFYTSSLWFLEKTSSICAVGLSQGIQAVQRFWLGRLFGLVFGI